MGGSIHAISAISDISGDGLDDVVMGSEDRKVYSINGKTGKTLWSYTTNQPVQWVVPVENPVTIFAGSKDNSVFLLDKTGGLEWKIDDAGNNSVSSQDVCYANLRTIRVISDINGDDKPDLLAVASTGDACTRNSRFVAAAIDSANGDYLWKYEHEQELHLLKESNIASSPVATIDLDDDKFLDVVLVDNNDIFYTIDGKTGKATTSDKITSNGLIWKLEAIPDINNDGTMDVLAFHAVDGGGGPNYAQISAIDLKSMTEVWKIDVGDNTYKSGAIYSAAVIGDKTTSYLAVIQRLDDDLHIVLLDSVNGEQLWKLDLGDDKSRNDLPKRYPVARIPDLDGDGFDEVAAGSINSSVYLLYGKTGEIKWQYPVNSKVDVLNFIAQDDKPDILAGDSVNRAYVLAGITRIESSLTVNLSSESVEALSQLTVSGRAAPVLPGELVELVYKDPDGQVFSHAAIIAKDGSYTSTIYPEKEGKWSVYAVLKGEGNYASVKSKTLDFTVVGRVSSNIYNLQVGEVFYPLRYTIDAGSVKQVTIENTSLKVGLDTDTEGSLSIHLPRTVIDARDTNFIVTIDDQIVRFEEAESNAEERVLVIPFPRDAKEITITGTHAIPEFEAIAVLSLAVAMVLIIHAKKKARLF